MADILNLSLSLGIALKLKKEKFEHVANGVNVWHIQYSGIASGAHHTSH